MSRRRSRGRSRSITDESDITNPSGRGGKTKKKIVRSSSAGKAAIMRVAAAEAAAEQAAGGGGTRNGAGRGGDTDSIEGSGSGGGGSGDDSSGGGDEFDAESENWHRSASNAAMEALDGERGRGLSDAIRENVAASFDLNGGAEEEEDDEEEEEEEMGYSRDGRSMEEAERRRLREKAFAIVLYASGDRRDGRTGEGDAKEKEGTAF